MSKLKIWIRGWLGIEQYEQQEAFEYAARRSPTIARVESACTDILDLRCDLVRLRDFIHASAKQGDDAVSSIAELELHKNTAKNSIDGINNGLSIIHNRLREAEARYDSLLADLKALREFVVGCAEFSDKVVARVGKIEKVVKRGKKTKRVKG